MSVQVKFVNHSRDPILIHPIPGSIFDIKLMAGKTLGRDAKIGTIEVMPMSGRPGEVHRPELQWLVKPTEITWEDCPDNCDFARYRIVEFFDGNVVKVKRRRFWKLPEMNWPTVEFYFESRKYRTHMFQLDTMTTLFNMIPGRRTVPPCSKYAPFTRWIFDEVENTSRIFDPITGKAMSTFTIGSGHGENKRSGSELSKIEEITARDKQERLAQII